MFNVVCKQHPQLQGDVPEVVVLHGCHWHSIEEYEVGIGVYQGFSYLTLGPFDYPDYLLPTSENSGYIDISVLFVF